MARAARKAKAKPSGRKAPASGKQRKYSRDNNGRFASTGTGATARGGRLLTAKGNKRKTQTITAAGQKGVLAKPKGLKPGSIKATAKPAAKPAAKRARTDGAAFAERNKRAGKISLKRGIKESDVLNNGPETFSKRVAATQQRQSRADRTAIAAKEFYRNYGSDSTFGRRPKLSTAGGDKFGTKVKAKKPATPKAAAKPAKKSRTPDAAKVSRMAARFQAKGAAPESSSKVKRLNTIETRQRAIAFLAKPNSKGADAAGAAAQNIAKRKTYSTTTPNRNKPLARASLGQREIREKNRKAAQGSATTRAEDTRKQTQREASQGTPKTSRAKAAAAQRIENSRSARKAANAAKAAANEVKFFRKDSDSQKYKNAVAKRDATLALRPKGSNKIAFRSTAMAVAAQRQRNGITAERGNIMADRKPGQGLRKTKTGMTQLGLLGPDKPLSRVRKVEGVKRPSGSKYKNSYGRTSTAKVTRGRRTFNGVRRAKAKPAARTTPSSADGKLSFRSRSKAAAAQRAKTSQIQEKTSSQIIGAQRGVKRTAAAGHRSEKVAVTKVASKQGNLLTGKTETTKHVKARIVPRSGGPSIGSKAARRSRGAMTRRMETPQSNLGRKKQRLRGIDAARAKKSPYDKKKAAKTLATRGKAMKYYDSINR